MSERLIAGIEARLAALEAHSLTRRRRVLDTPCAPEAQVDGLPLLSFCSNDYLGLANHPRVVEALCEGARRYGAGSGASALVSGHSGAHHALEERLAAFMAPVVEQCGVLTFGTGYLANLSMLTALGADDDAEIFSEALNHASLIDGARLARAQVKVYPHADLDALAALLDASSARTRLVATDSVFSMDGNIAPLRELLALCERHDAWLLVDDAHGFGVLGEHGRGALEALGLRSSNIVYMGTLGKAAGVAGAFVAAHASVTEWLLQRARPYIYTTAPPPALSHALLASLDIIEGGEGRERRARLATLVAQLRRDYHPRAWRHPVSATPIQPVLIGDNDAALAAAAALRMRGLWVPAIRPPTVPAGTARLRVSLSAAHTAGQLAQLIGALHEIEGEGA
jgi:8-amino-7-oxononanoate synthase